MSTENAARRGPQALAIQAVRRLAEQYESRRDAVRPAFHGWMTTFSAIYGDRFLTPGIRAAEALRRLYGVPESAGFHELLFCAHACFAMLVRATAEAGGVRLRQDNEWFDWPRLDAAATSQVMSGPDCDLFKPLYHALVPREVRHAMGEYHTPDWLAELLLDETGYDGDPARRLLDPSCGTGTFLVLAIRRAKSFAGARRIFENIRGFELNPLAALAARANYLLALGGTGEPPYDFEPPVVQADSLLGPLTGEFDFVVGNPPWVRWDHLSREYREATLPLWRRYGLFSLKGFQARLGAGKKDLSMLFTYSAADRFLKDGGTLGFVITQEVFKSKGAGEGFRRFRIGEDGATLRVVKAHDFTSLRPFEGVSNKTAAIILTKGGKTIYPVPYFVWERRGDRLEKTPLEARPLGGYHGAWRTLPEGEAPSPPWPGESPYKAMLGANANPYGVFWLAIERTLGDGTALVRNLVEMGRKNIPGVSAAIETELVFPAVRGRDIARWGAEPRIHVLLVQDPRARRGYSAQIMRERWPAAYDYLSRFREELLSRALYRKYHEHAGHPFYSQFNIGEETFAPFKVVWKRMSNDMTACVLSRSSGPLGDKMVVPLETTAFIATDCEQEAHYLCAILNSQRVRSFIRSFSSAGRGFGSPSVIRHAGVPAFDECNAIHRDLARLSAMLQEGGRNRLDQSALEDEVERLVSDLHLNRAVSSH